MGRVPGRGRTWERLAATCVCLIFGAATAWASAWNAPHGAGLLIVDFTSSGGGRYFDRTGALSSVAAYQKEELYSYLEYGVTDWLMAVVKPELTRISADSTGGPTSRYTGLGTGEAAAQLRVLAYGPAVLAVSAGLRLPGSTDEANPALVGNRSYDKDLRVLGGTSFLVGPYPAFLDLQAGYRFRSGIAPDEWHGDFTAGVRPLPRLLLYAQSLNTLSQKPAASAVPGNFYSKASLTAVYDLMAAWSVELGGYQTVAGVDALRERGFKTGVWYRF